MADNSTVTQQGSMLLLQNVAQTLPTNPITDLAIQAITPVPSSPASPLTVQPTVPLAGAAPQQYQAPAPTPPALTSKAKVALAVVGVAAVWFLFLRKK